MCVFYFFLMKCSVRTPWSREEKEIIRNFFKEEPCSFENIRIEQVHKLKKKYVFKSSDMVKRWLKSEQEKLAKARIGE